jgi:hypothetical protein
MDERDSVAIVRRFEIARYESTGFEASVQSDKSRSAEKAKTSEQEGKREPIRPSDRRIAAECIRSGERSKYEIRSGSETRKPRESNATVEDEKTESDHTLEDRTEEDEAKG